MTDELLMRAVKHGDVAQLGRLFERHRSAVFNFLARTIGDRTAAEDLVQDVFVRVLKYRHTYRDDHVFGTWLFRIARNARADHYRRQQATRTVPLLAFDAPSQHEDASAVLERTAEVKLFDTAFRLLPDDKRELLVLARFQQMPYEQIAALLDIEIGTVKVRVHRAVAALRDLVEQLSVRGDPCAAKTPPSTSSPL
jgi:RNA polymerase sigma-70 factor (ECF subfamily)